MFHCDVNCCSLVHFLAKTNSSPLKLKCASGKAGLQERINARKMSETISFLNVKCYSGAGNGLLLTRLFLMLWGVNRILQSSLGNR